MESVANLPQLYGMTLMSKGKYVVPVVMGQLSNELFLVKGDIPRASGISLVRLNGERGITAKDERAASKIYERTGKPSVLPSRVKEATVINDDTAHDISDLEATLVMGFINNTLPGAFKAPEFKNWFIYERGDLTPLKLARFSINLLEHSERRALVSSFKHRAAPSYNTHYEKYR